LNKLSQQDTWQDYYVYKCEFAQLTRREETELREFVESQAWLPIVEKLLAPEGRLGVPEKRLINKLGKATKRVVYSFAVGEQQVLKVLAWLLYYYDDAQPPECYSFRRGYGAHKAIRRLTSLPNIDSLYCYKLDIQDYFNSIDVAKLLPILAEVFADDKPLYSFFKGLLTADEAVLDGKVIHEKRGAMAGTPTAPFLANLYLREMDHVLATKAAAYARYSDDIIIFAESAERRDELRVLAREMLAGYGLKPNPAKEHCSAPGEVWEFLGFAYQQGVIDLSEATQRKLKGKISRKARALRRWMKRKDASPERTIAAMIRSMNRKFYGEDRKTGAQGAQRQYAPGELTPQFSEQGSSHELTWSRWFFPLINTSVSLARIDAYLQQELRTIATGRHSKTNYKLRYQSLKELGYRSLVNEYYRFKKAREKRLPHSVY